MYISIFKKWTEIERGNLTVEEEEDERYRR
jgi:hypothetical protein